MGKRDKKPKIKKFEDYSSSEEEKRKAKNIIEEVSDDDEANEDLSLKIVQKSMERIANKNPRDDGVVDLKDEKKKKKMTTEKKKRKKSKEDELVDDAVADEIDTGFKDFCGDLFAVDNVKGRNDTESEKALEVSTDAVETSQVEAPDNVVLRKLLRGPRYFDPPDKSWAACYNCGEEDHTIANCTSAKRKKPCFVCGSFEHNAKQCSKAKDCFICKQHGHRAKDCPDRNKLSKMCLKCGDFGHDMFSCRNDYCPGDLKEIKCYTCGRFGHLCCVNYGDSSATMLSCYRCGLSGHTGLACSGSRNDADDVASVSSCYKCGEEGHFARECINSRKATKRNREPSTPKQKSPRKNKVYMEYRSEPRDLDKQKKKKSHHDFASATKTKQRGGWSTEHPGDYYNSEAKSHHWRSPSTPIDRKLKYSYSNGEYKSGSHSSKKPRNRNVSDSTSNGYHKYSTSRFGNNSNDRVGRNYDWW